MTTILDGQLKRELTIAAQSYTVTLTPDGFTLALKGRRIGLTLAWADLVSGDAALANALNASLRANIRVSPKPAASKRAPRKKARA